MGYRQNYCGCVFSKREQEEKMKQKQIYITKIPELSGF